MPVPDYQTLMRAIELGVGIALDRLRGRRERNRFDTSQLRYADVEDRSGIIGTRTQIVLSTLFERPFRYSRNGRF